MSSITVPKAKTWGRSAASSRVESAVVPVMPAATPIQRRTAKKSKYSNARATVHLVDSVREVVQAFELEYSQARTHQIVSRIMHMGASRSWWGCVVFE